MPEHSTRNTEARSAFCNHCGKVTMHAVSDGRLGRCNEHQSPALSKKQQQERARRADQAKNPRLF
jgi:hypothetical protein